MLPDIDTEQRVEFLVKTFYGRVLKDEVLAPHFKDIDFPSHFKGNVFDKHVGLNIHETEFEHWILHFNNTVNDFFEGEKANLANQRAELLKYTFLSKLNQINKGV
jgi:hemoglobin